MKLYLKVIDVHVILTFLELLLLLELLRRWLLRVLVLGLLRWINVYSRTHGQKQYTLGLRVIFKEVGGLFSKTDRANRYI